MSDPLTLPILFVNSDNAIKRKIPYLIIQRYSASNKCKTSARFLIYLYFPVFRRMISFPKSFPGNNEVFWFHVSICTHRFKCVWYILSTVVLNFKTAPSLINGSLFMWAPKSFCLILVFYSFLDFWYDKIIISQQFSVCSMKLWVLEILSEHLQGPKIFS